MGESSLQITARLFLDDLNLRLPTQHELLVAILEKFNREKIEVPFPQRDLHIRSIGPDVMSLFEGRSKDSIDNLRANEGQ
jgi:potassium efflux system protein